MSSFTYMVQCRKCLHGQLDDGTPAFTCFHCNHFNVSKPEAEQPNPISPAHYKQKVAECIDIAETMNFNLGNALKYIWRAGKKDPSKLVEDLRKAQWYVEREIQRLGANCASDP